MEKSDFDRLLERYLKGEVTEQERIKLEAWLDVVKNNVPDGLELDRDTEDKLFQKITSHLDNTQEIIALVPKQRGIRHWIVRMAATLLIIAAASYVVLYLREQGERVLGFVGDTRVEKLILSDGSLVWLRGDSKLVYHEMQQEGIRYSELEGEALFEIAKDATRPFILQCGDVRLQVLGTSFSVKTGTNQLELKVLTGKVNLSSRKNNVAINVNPCEEVIYHNGEVERRTLARQAIDAAVAYTEYNMQFSNAPMLKVFQRIEEKFDVKIHIHDRSLGRCRITADLTDHSLESTLQMIKEVLAINYYRSDDVIVVSGSGCN